MKKICWSALLLLMLLPLQAQKQLAVMTYNIRNAKGMDGVSSLLSWFKEYIHSFLHLVFPRCCVVCGDPLDGGEECLCIRCNMQLPRTGFHLAKNNPLEPLFWGIVQVERISAYFHYNKGSDYRLIVHHLKYSGRKEIGEIMGRYMAAELSPSGFFKGIGLIIPVPLHQKRQNSRGYNQSEWIARGISVVTGIPIDTQSIVRLRHTNTQTQKSIFERRASMEGAFLLQHPETVAGKHILIVDDVLTTGSTILECACTLTEATGVKISILTLAAAQQ